MPFRNRFDVPHTEHTKAPLKTSLLPRIPFIGNLSSYIKALPLGDRVIASALLFLVLCSTVVSLYTFEKKFLIRIPAHGGTITEGVIGTPRFVNPLLAISDTDRDLVALTYAGLMGHSATGELIPVLAESYTISEDGRTYTFLLRAGSTFSDGTPVTADDIVYTVQKAQDPILKSPAYSNWANVRAESVDARTIRFTLSRAYPPFLEDTTLGILPAHIWKNISDAEFPFSPYTIQPVGAGPFTPAKVTRDASGTVTSYTTKSFSGYALGTPYLTAINFLFYTDVASLNTALSNGTVQNAYGIPRAGAHIVPYTQIFAVFFNQTSVPVFAHPEVRKALSLALDRKDLVENILGGYALAIDGPLPSMKNEATAEFTHLELLEQAKSALTAEGWKFSTTTSNWTKGKENLSFTLKTVNLPELKTIAGLAQKNWQELGVPVSLEFYTPGELSQSVIRPRAFEALLFGEVTGASPDLFAFWHSSGRTDPGLNIAGYSDKTVDALLAKAQAAKDPNSREDALHSASEVIRDSYAAAFTHTPYFIYATSPRLYGITLTTITSPSDRFNGVSGWYTESALVWPYFVPKELRK